MRCAQLPSRLRCWRMVLSKSAAASARKCAGATHASWRRTFAASPAEHEEVCRKILLHLLTLATVGSEKQDNSGGLNAFESNCTLCARHCVHGISIRCVHDKLRRRARAVAYAGIWRCFRAASWWSARSIGAQDTPHQEVSSPAHDRTQPQSHRAPSAACASFWQRRSENEEARSELRRWK